ncbi:N-acetylmuramoyl-L-alanine amidase [Georgenia alba]|uniref:N-acetylmuramoyl-L-alanine amidase n=1 Tax=Georgenia alba TaxID=2233858 RepID=A0ABW2Q224_9MICO
MPTPPARLLLLLGLVLGVLAAAVGLRIGSAPLAEPSPSPEPTSASPSPSPSAPPPLEGLHVVLDPGHNGGNGQAPAEINAQVEDGRGGWKACNTVGTSTLSGYPEHAFTWDVAQRTRELLEEDGATITLTRSGDDGVGPCIDERGRAVQRADADAMVSIHANGSEDPSVRGYFAIVAAPPLHDAQGGPSRRLAEDLLGALDDGDFTPSTWVPGALSERPDLATLNWARRPAVMLELAEMRNPEEAALVQSRDGRQRYADAIAAGLRAWAERRGG